MSLLNPDDGQIEVGVYANTNLRPAMLPADFLLPIYYSID